MTYIKTLPIRTVVALVNKAAGRERKEFAFRNWLAIRSIMNQETYQSWEDYWEERQPQVADTRPREEIIRDVMRIK